VGVHGAPVKTTSLMTTSGCSVQLPSLKYLADATNAISLLNPGTHALSELNSTELEFPWSTNSNAQTRLHMNSRVLCSRFLNTSHQGLTTESLAPKSRNQDQDPGNMDSRPRPRPCRQGLKTKNLAIYTRGRDRELAAKIDALPSGSQNQDPDLAVHILETEAETKTSPPGFQGQDRDLGHIVQRPRPGPWLKELGSTRVSRPWNTPAGIHIFRTKRPSSLRCLLPIRMQWRSVHSARPGLFVWSTNSAIRREM